MASRQSNSDHNVGWFLIIYRYSSSGYKNMFSSLVFIVALLFIACGMTTSVKANSQLLVRPIKVIQKIVASSMLALSLQSNVALADTADQSPPVVPLLTKRSADLQPYNDIGRGFKMLRPFGFNEFDGAGGGYAVKFASLVCFNI